MSLFRCTGCDRYIDADVQVESRFYPIPICEDCVETEQLEKEMKATKKYGFNWFTTYSRSSATGGV